MAGLPGETRRGSSLQRNMFFIDSRVSSGFIGHSYFYSHPAVLSDLILILRDGRDPGAENGRPLGREEGTLFWSIDDDYLRDREEE